MARPGREGALLVDGDPPHEGPHRAAGEAAPLEGGPSRLRQHLPPAHRALARRIDEHDVGVRAGQERALLGIEAVGAGRTLAHQRHHGRHVDEPLRHAGEHRGEGRLDAGEPERALPDVALAGALLLDGRRGVVGGDQVDLARGDATPELRPRLLGARRRRALRPRAAGAHVGVGEPEVVRAALDPQPGAAVARGAQAIDDRRVRGVRDHRPGARGAQRLRHRAGGGELRLERAPGEERLAARRPGPAEPALGGVRHLLVLAVREHEAVEGGDLSERAREHLPGHRRGTVERAGEELEGVGAGLPERAEAADVRGVDGADEPDVDVEAPGEVARLAGERVRVEDGGGVVVLEQERRPVAGGGGRPAREVLAVGADGIRDVHVAVHDAGHHPEPRRVDARRRPAGRTSHGEHAPAGEVEIGPAGARRRPDRPAPDRDLGRLLPNRHAGLPPPAEQPTGAASAGRAPGAVEYPRRRGLRPRREGGGAWSSASPAGSRS